MNLKAITNILGIILIILGISGFIYRGITYKSDENIAQIGGLKVTAQEEKTIPIEPWMSGLVLIAGIVLVVVGRK